MKKLLLTIILLLFQTFPSFGNPNGKGIVCIDEKILDSFDKLNEIDTVPKLSKFVRGFSFLDGKVTLNYLDKKNDDVVILKSPQINFTTTTKIIEWGGSVDIRWELDRKTLKLKEISKTTLQLEYQCEVFLKDDYTVRMEEYRDIVQQSYDEELKKLDNKI